jgi:hypothetical protein
MSDKTYVRTLPDCDIHKYHHGVPGVPAKYDAKTSNGSWANMCEPCWVERRWSPELGTGKGQELVVGDAPARNVQAEVLAAIHAGDMDAAWDAIGDGDPLDFL